MLTEKKKADREIMAAMVKALCGEMGAECEIRDMAKYVYSDGSGAGPKSREIQCRITLGEGRVGVEFDGANKTQYDGYCMPWNTAIGSKARMTNAFGRAVGADVNPFHRAKCMGFAYGIDELLMRLRSAMECINRGEAFEILPGVN